MYSLQSLPSIVALLIALSVCTERFVEIIKGMVWWLSAVKTDPKTESLRFAALQVLAVIGGIVISLLAWPVATAILPGENKPMTIIALGFLASGGSGFWNSILGYVTGLKNTQEAVSATAAALAPKTTP